MDELTMMQWEEMLDEMLDEEILSDTEWLLIEEERV